MAGDQLDPLQRELSGNCTKEHMSSLNGNNNIHDLIEQSHRDSECDFNDFTDTRSNGDISAVDVKNTSNEGPLWLGFVEKPKKRSCLLRQNFPSKAGGNPAWLDPIHLPKGRSIFCGFCEEPLQFVLQAYAPIIESESAYHRTIFVFMCPSMHCLQRDQLEQQKHNEENVPRSVKVFRCQLPLVNPFYKDKSHSINGSTDHTETEDVLCSWCGTWKGDQLCSGCKRERYCSKKHQVLHWRSSHKGECQQLNSALQTNRKGHSSFTFSACKFLWPEYEVILEERSESNTLSSDRNGSHNSIALVPSDVNGSSSELASVQEMESLLDYFKADEAKKCLASFVKHTKDDPDQVLRCWISNGKPLWPELNGRPSSASIPKCHYCNGPMRFEFQIMPQLLFYFNVENDVNSLDWATIAVYTCEASCNSAVAYKEEFPWVQLYT